MPVEPFQARVAHLALRAAAAHGFALAGGNALAAHGLLSRPTEDVDLLTPQPGGPGRVLQAVRTALLADGFQVQVVRSPADHVGEFAQLQVSRNGRTTELDLWRDWRAHEVVSLEVGPVLHLDDAVGAKVTAMLGRGLPRDYLDVAAGSSTSPGAGYLSWPSNATPVCGSTTSHWQCAVSTGCPTCPFGQYRLRPQDVTALRARFSDWPRDSDLDDEAQTAHTRAHTERDRPGGPS